MLFSYYQRAIQLKNYLFWFLKNKTVNYLYYSTLCIKDLEKLNLVKLDFGSLVLGWSQFMLLSEQPQNMTFASKVVKIDSKMIISLVCLNLWHTLYVPCTLLLLFKELARGTSRRFWVCAKIGWIKEPSKLIHCSWWKGCLDSCSQFYQHFTSSFCGNFLLQKNYKP